MKLSDIDLGWVAGFIEGEGYFGWAGTTPNIQVAQVQYWPLEKMKELCGGNISFLKRKAIKGEIYYRWYIYGKGATELIKLIYPLLSPRRKEQAKKVYTRRYKQINKPKPHKTHCIHGHALTADNIIKTSRGDKVCKVCHRKQNNECSARNKIKEGDKRLWQLIMG